MTRVGLDLNKQDNLTSKFCQNRSYVQLHHYSLPWASSNLCSSQIWLFHSWFYSHDTQCSCSSQMPMDWTEKNCDVQHLYWYTSKEPTKQRPIDACRGQQFSDAYKDFSSLVRSVSSWLNYILSTLKLPWAPSAIRLDVLVVTTKDLCSQTPHQENEVCTASYFIQQCKINGQHIEVSSLCFFQPSLS